VIPSPGMRIGPYELQSRIGAGGMGEVWKARDTRRAAAHRTQRRITDTDLSLLLRSGERRRELERTKRREKRYDPKYGAAARQ
jgi:serine/threonine protein kinase